MYSTKGARRTSHQYFLLLFICNFCSLESTRTPILFVFDSRDRRGLLFWISPLCWKGIWYLLWISGFLRTPTVAYQWGIVTEPEAETEAMSYFRFVILRTVDMVEALRIWEYLLSTLHTVISSVKIPLTFWGRLQYNRRPCNHGWLER